MPPLSKRDPPIFKGFNKLENSCTRIAYRQQEASTFSGYIREISNQFESNPFTDVVLYTFSCSTLSSLFFLQSAVVMLKPKAPGPLDFLFPSFTPVLVE